MYSSLNVPSSASLDIQLLSDKRGELAQGERRWRTPIYDMMMKSEHRNPEVLTSSSELVLMDSAVEPSIFPSSIGDIPTITIDLFDFNTQEERGSMIQDTLESTDIDMKDSGDIAIREEEENTTKDKTVDGITADTSRASNQNQRVQGFSWLQLTSDLKAQSGIIDASCLRNDQYMTGT